MKQNDPNPRHLDIFPPFRTAIQETHQNYLNRDSLQRVSFYTHRVASALGAQTRPARRTIGARTSQQTRPSREKSTPAPLLLLPELSPHLSPSSQPADSDPLVPGPPHGCSISSHTRSRCAHPHGRCGLAVEGAPPSTWAGAVLTSDLWGQLGP